MIPTYRKASLSPFTPFHAHFHSDAVCVAHLISSSHAESDSTTQTRPDPVSSFQKGTKVPHKEMSLLSVTKHTTKPQWNYNIAPRCESEMSVSFSETPYRVKKRSLFRSCAFVCVPSFDDGCLLTLLEVSLTRRVIITKACQEATMDSEPRQIGCSCRADSECKRLI